MLTGERLFAGDSEISVLESVRQGQVRRRARWTPRCRARWTRSSSAPWRIDPQDRFQSAGEMKQRLEAALSALSPSTGPTDLALYIQRVLEPDTLVEPAEAPAPPPAPSPWPAEPPAAASFAAAPPLPYSPPIPTPRLPRCRPRRRSRR